MEYIIDIETTGLNPRTDKIHGVGVLTLLGSKYFTNSQLFNLDFSKASYLVGHNIRFDYKFLIAKELPPHPSLPIFCTKLLASLVLPDTSFGLKELTKQYLGDQLLQNKEELDNVILKANLTNVGELCKEDLKTGDYSNIISSYCLEDCKNTKKLFDFLVEKLKAVDNALKNMGFKEVVSDYYKKEAAPFEVVVAHMELRGVLISKERVLTFKAKLEEDSRKYLADLEKLVAEDIDEIEEELYQIERAKRKSAKGKDKVERSSIEWKTKFNWYSNRHLGRLLSKYIPVKLRRFTASGQLDVSEKKLANIRRLCSQDKKLSAILDKLADYKKLQKLITTYVGREEDCGLLSCIHEDGKVYPDFHTVDGTVTGRLSCSNPNIQNLPRKYPEIKRCFIPNKDHVFIYFDYSQIELRWAAELSRDEKMVSAYTVENIDLHEKTAKELNIERPLAKTLNFALIYGCSAYRLQLELPDFSVEDCQKFRDHFFAVYSGYEAYLESQVRFVRDYGFVISPFGRIRRLPQAQTASLDSKEYRHAINQALNFPIQSAAASTCKRAMIALHKLGYKIVNQVHDAVYIEIEKERAKKEINKIKEVAENTVKISIPLKVEIKILQSFDESDIIEL